MRFAVDTSALQFAVAGPPRPLQRQPQDLADAGDRGEVGADYEPWRVPLVVAGAGPYESVRVTVPGDPRLEVGSPVTVEGLTLLTWRRRGGWGWSLRARAITVKPAAASRGRP